MATGIDFVKSTDKASEEYFEHECSACSADGESIQSVKFCTDCSQKLCTKCLKYHNRFAAMRLHNILDVEAMTGLGPQPAKYVPTERCEIHHGSFIDTFCGNHDVVCCPTCVSVNHRSCKDITYILDAAADIMNTAEYKTIKDGIAQLQAKLNQLKKMKQDDCNKLEEAKVTCLTHIHGFRKKLNKHLDDLEKAAEVKVQTKHKEYEDRLNADIKALEDMQATLEASIDQLEKVKTDNEPLVFVYVKTGKKNQIDGNKLLQEIQAIPRQQPPMFKTNTAVEKLLNSITALGDLIQDENANIKDEKDKDVTSTTNIKGTTTNIHESLNNNFVNKMLEEKQIQTKLVEKVFRAVDRGDYYLPDQRHAAYKNQPWKNGHLHLSAPSIYTAVMEALQLKPGLAFLNMGSGTGYLSTMVGLILGQQGKNIGVELHKDVVAYAQDRLKEFKKNSTSLDNFDFCEPTFYVGNCLQMQYGTQLYDRLYVGAACPPEYENYVKSRVSIGGILVMPLNDKLIQANRVGETDWRTKIIFSVSFGKLVTP